MAAPGRRLSPHFHDEANLILVSWGASRIRLGGRDMVLRAPALVYIPAGSAHACNADPAGGLGYSVLALEPGALPRAPVPSGPAILGLDPEGLATYASIFDAVAADPSGSAMAGILVLLSRPWPSANPGGPAARPGRAEGLAEEAAAVLEESCGDKLRLGALASGLGVSPWALVRAFRGRFDLSPGEYLQSLRVNRALSLLRQGEAPAQVAQECGFCDQGHLGRVFRRVSGLSPGAYAGLVRAKPSKTGAPVRP